MNDNSDVDDKDFGEKVLDEYYTLKTLKATENLDDTIKKGFKSSLWGCLFVPIFGVMNKFVKRTVAAQINKTNYIEFEKEAILLISQKEIKEAICKSITSLNKNEILTENRFVKLVAKSISENNLRKQFVIPLEPILFAFIAYLIFQNGLENFCDET